MTVAGLGARRKQEGAMRTRPWGVCLFVDVEVLVLVIVHMTSLGKAFAIETHVDWTAQ
jgi:hypothetical protein